MGATLKRGTLAIAMLAVVAAFAALTIGKHVEAPYVRIAVEDVASGEGKNTDRLSVFYSRKIGTVLFKVRLNQARSGGIVFRTTTNGPNRELIPLAAKSYETTCFACSEAYWNRVIFRDGYTEVARVSTSMVAGGIVAFFVAMAALSKKLSDAGFVGMAGYLDSEVRRGYR
jgi:hypothetical protein